MQILTNFPSLIDQWLRYRFQTVLVVCFLLWTPLLVIETLQIQHSCHPMINWSGTLPAECQSNSSTKCECVITPPPPKIIISSVVAIGVASTVAFVASVPLAVVVGIGTAVWFVIRAVL